MKFTLLSLFLYAFFGEAVPNQIKVQGLSSCAVVSGKVRCWGHGYEHDSRPLKKLALAQQVGVSDDFACALTLNPVEPVQCWGSVPAATPIGFSAVSEIAVGAYHACALDQSKVVCWGSNHEGQLNLPFLPLIRSISAASDYTCAISKKNEVFCWGETQPHVQVPPHVRDVAQISTGWPTLYAPNGHEGAHVCALLLNGSVTCWGSNTYGQLDVPADLKNVVKVSAGSGFTCALLKNQDVRCWGSKIQLPSTPLTGVLDVSANRELCVSTSQNTTCYGVSGEWVSPPALPLTGLTSADFGVFCGLNNSDIYCFGHKPLFVSAELGNTNNVVFSDYVEGGCAFDNSASAISCWGKNEKPNHFPADIHRATDIKIWRPGYGCAVIEGVQKCWSSYSSKIGPRQEMQNVKKIFLGSGANCLLFSDGQLSCYDENQNEIKLPPLSNVTDVVINEVYGCAIADGRIQCWGDSKQAPGLNRLPSYLNVSRIVTDVGGDNMCAIVAGWVDCWGMLSWPRPLPAPPADIVDVLDLSISPIAIHTTGHACALMKNGIRCWGRNDFGQSNVPSDLLNF